MSIRQSLRSPTYRRIIPIGFYLTLFIFLVFYLKGIDVSKLKNVDIDWFYVGLAIIIGLIFRFWQVFIWFVLLKSLGAKGLHKAWRQLVYVYAKSWLGRYIPGTAPWILGKIYFASKQGISKNKLAVSSLLEGALQVTVLMGVSFLMLIFDSRLRVISGNDRLLMTIILILCVIAVLPPVFNRIISLAYKTMKHTALEREHLASSRTIVKGASLYTIGALISGLSLFFMAKAVDPTLSYHNMLFVMGAGNLAGAASMLVVFAPSGLGVREGIQLLLLSAIMPRELALLVTIFSRLDGVASDLIFLGLSKLLALRGGST